MYNKQFQKASANAEIIVWIAIAIILIGVAVKFYPKTTVVTIDDCQYIRSWNGHGYSLTHKGNCTNSLHKR
jgi:hypothetical protein